ncbi:Calx-beta domain-containing protein [Nocardioides sp. Kera G14]|uniref:Calx-beta domain-containing protein n=1 Tax=Nocardioides sp. Kera G14 TaxID=2884264 RepID=UPI001D0FC0D9|nr:Calx-beta domain-containing protein [Nocardioides sp. Kera G14]UDY22340.1 hypothetical protein LH076_09625 [Nocardioides sp. Kera G14]
MKTTSRILSGAAVGALALGATAPAAMAHEGHHRGHAKPFAGARPTSVAEGAGTAAVKLKLRKPATEDITYTWSTLDRTVPSSTSQRRGTHTSYRGFRGHNGAYKGYKRFATAGEDYTASSGTVTIKAGERSATVTVPVLDDTTDERSEVFLVKFRPTADSTATPSSRSGTHSSHRGFHRGFSRSVIAPVTIIDND